MFSMFLSPCVLHKVAGGGKNPLQRKRWWCRTVPAEEEGRGDEPLLGVAVHVSHALYLMLFLGEKPPA